MNYPDFAGIEVTDRIGVSPVGRDTLTIARHVSRMKFSRALDVGTGSGFIPVYLTAIGRRCDGCDIDERALTSARANAEANRLEVAFFRSDLFASVANVYDLVIFNPPYGSIGAGLWASIARVLKSLLPKESPGLSRLAYWIVRRSRFEVIRRFLREYPSHLSEGGMIVMLLHLDELELVYGPSCLVLAELGPQRLVLLNSRSQP